MMRFFFQEKEIVVETSGFRGFLHRICFLKTKSRQNDAISCEKRKNSSTISNRKQYWNKNKKHRSFLQCLSFA